jgi:hypothetical protein
MKRLSAFLESENNRLYKPAGFLILNPLSNGLLYVPPSPHPLQCACDACDLVPHCRVAQQLQILDFRRVADRGTITRSTETSKDV